MANQHILVFGGGALQTSLIQECKNHHLITVVIDPDPDAPGKALADTFECIPPNDFVRTCEVVERNHIDAIITAATDKPLVMMAEIAKKYGFPFISAATALLSTDKWLMKEALIKNNIPCAKGSLVHKIDDEMDFPLILKPRDSSGSKGVVYCENQKDASQALAEILSFSKHSSALAEKVIRGKEYSIEALHFNGQDKVIQITEKHITPPPYFVELAHIQPCGLPAFMIDQINLLTKKIASAFGFTNCASHNEIKIYKDNIKVIEVSPRLGGDYITSMLVPLSTGINMEESLIQIALGISPVLKLPFDRSVGVFYFNFEGAQFKAIPATEEICQSGLKQLCFSLPSEKVAPKIKSSHDRYGHVILQHNSRQELLHLKKEIFSDFYDRYKKP